MLDALIPLQHGCFTCVAPTRITAVNGMQLMNPYVDTRKQFVTAALLAVFEDSGWYLPDYTKADGMVVGRDWGFQQGCTFAKEKCITSLQSTGSPAHFHTATDTSVCTIDRTAVGHCTVATYNDDLPSQYQYFANAAMGGSSNMYDYCPAVSAYSDGVCTTEANAPDSNARYVGESYGASSACFDSTLLWTGYRFVYHPYVHMLTSRSIEGLLKPLIYFMQ
jgi:hypothetical protein